MPQDQTSLPSGCTSLPQSSRQAQGWCSGGGRWLDIQDPPHSSQSLIPPLDFDSTTSNLGSQTYLALIIRGEALRSNIGRTIISCWWLMPVCWLQQSVNESDGSHLDPQLEPLRGVSDAHLGVDLQVQSPM
jgi:hypothetical protein